MTKVFLGRISIPGDEIDNYIVAIGDRESEFQPLRRQLNGEFKRFLGRSFTPKTVRKHSGVIELFIDFLEWHTDVTSIDDITRGIANSYFRKWYFNKIGDLRESELKTAMKKFFRFLAEKKNIVNDPVLNSFKH
jgi:site-specific recombinase XerD